MRALTYHGPEDIRCERIADPPMLAPTDAMVAVRLAAVCGSDLHVWHGRETGLDPGTVMGHEFVGEVVEVGPSVEGLRPGMLVVAPFTTSCGACFFCRSGLSARCEAGELFGWVERGRGLHGGQGEFVRVPLAASTLVEVPPDLSPPAALLLGDVLATGHHAARLAEVGPGRTAAVIGCGPVGLMAVLAARELGADAVFAIDAIPERLDFAARLGAVPVRLGPEAAGEIAAATAGRGADGVLECVGSSAAAELAYRVVRTGGTIAAVGVHHEPAFPWSPGQAYDRNLTYRAGRCPARSYLPDLIPVARRHQTTLGELFTHRVPLEQGADAYRLFASRSEGCLKVALTP